MELRASCPEYQALIHFALQLKANGSRKHGVLPSVPDMVLPLSFFFIVQPMVLELYHGKKTHDLKCAEAVCAKMKAMFKLTANDLYPLPGFYNNHAFTYFLLPQPSCFHVLQLL
jgi:hypothetical protein